MLLCFTRQTFLKNRILHSCGTPWHLDLSKNNGINDAENSVLSLCPTANKRLDIRMRRKIREKIDQTLHPWRRVFYTSFVRFQNDKREASRCSFPISSTGEIVLDFGGFQGDWAQKMLDQYNCKVHIFEPHPVFANSVRVRFTGTPSVEVHEFALGCNDGELQLDDAGDASSSRTTKAANVTGYIKSTQEFFSSLKEKEFAVAKINIEGGEYSLIPSLIEANVISQIRILQIQFHLYEKADIERRQEIIQNLSKTHRCVWSYPFVWEEWHLKADESN